MLCKYCNTPNRDDGKFCKSCGQRLELSANVNRKLAETDSQTVQLPESDLPPTYAPPGAAPPSTYTPPPSADYTPPGYTPPHYTPPGYNLPGSSAPGFNPTPNQAATASGWRHFLTTRGFKLLVGSVLLLIILVGGGVLLSMFMPSLRPEGKEILLTMPQRSDEFDLYMVKAGQTLDSGQLLVESVQSAADGYTTFFYVMQSPTYQAVSLAPIDFGGFVPSSNRLLYWYRDKEDVYVEEIQTNKDTPTEIMKTDALPLRGLLFADNDDLFLQETRSSQERCYAANPDQAAERITKGDDCWATQDGSYVWAEDRNSGEFSLSLYPLDGKGDPITILEDEEDIGQYVVARNGDYVAYIQYERAGWQLVSVATQEGITTEVGEPAETIHQFGFLGDTETLFYISENDEDRVELFISDHTTSLAEGVGMVAVGADNGRYLIYQVVDEDGESTVVSYDVDTATSQTLLAEDDLRFNIISAHDVVLLTVQDGDDLLLYRANLDGSNVELLLDETHVSLSDLQYTLDQDRLYVRLHDDGYESLFTTSLSKADGFYLLEDWNDIVLFNQTEDGRSLVFMAQEDAGDDYILYTVAQEKGASLVELDDQYEYYTNAVFTENGREVIYTGVGGDDFDDVDVLQVAADGEDSAEVLYPEAQLLSVRWQLLSPFQNAYFTYVYASN